MLKVLSLSRLPEIYPPWAADCELGDYAGIGKCDEVECIDDPWESKFWTGQGDIGESKLIYTDENGMRHLVLMNYYDFHDELSYFGNIVEGEQRPKMLSAPVRQKNENTETF